MDIKKAKSNKDNEITVTDIYNFASGDNAGEPRRCCRICAGERGLRRFCETKDQFDYRLFRCFGVVVTPLDCLICEVCAHQLNSSEQFSSLVKAAFANQHSDESVSSATTCVTCVTQTELETLTIKPPTVMKDSQETFPILPKYKKVKEKIQPAPVAKKIIVACNTCKQRYPKLSVSGGSVEDFVCSRCKYQPVKRKADSVAMSARLNHEKRDIRKKPKLLKDTPKLLPVKPPKKCESVLKYHCEPRKYQCSQCTEKFLFPQRLAEHVKSVHKESLDNSCLVCAKNFKTQTILEKHLKIHTGDLYQCDVCMKIFRNNHALQVHYASHNASHIKKNKALG